MFNEFVSPPPAGFQHPVVKNSRQKRPALPGSPRFAGKYEDPEFPGGVDMAWWSNLRRATVKAGHMYHEHC